MAVNQITSGSWRELRVTVEMTDPRGTKTTYIFDMAQDAMVEIAPFDGLNPGGLHIDGDWVQAEEKKN